MKKIKVLLLYPPEQSWPGTMVKPNGSLAYPYLGAALKNIGIETYVYDACVGNNDDDINDFFNKSVKLPSGMIKTGVRDERILEIAKNYDAVGITSIFSQQETQVLHCARLIKKNYPEINILHGDARKMPIKNDSYDIVFSSATIEHVGSFKNQIEFLSELYRVSKKGVFITTPNRFFPIDFHTALPLIHIFPKKIHRKILNILNYKELAKEENLNLISVNDLINMCKNLGIKKYKIKKIRILGLTSNLILVIEKVI